MDNKLRLLAIAAKCPVCEAGFFSLVWFLACTEEWMHEAATTTDPKATWAKYADAATAKVLHHTVCGNMLAPINVKLAG